MDYLMIKHAHVGFVGFSITLFTLRGIMQFSGIDWRRWRLLKILPHLNDTLLLCAAVWLAVTSHQYPFVAPWLTAKVFGLLAYIGFGMLALRRQAPLNVPAFIAALASVAYVVLVAISRSPTLGLA
ncbi:MAG: SirB2 family protein [Formivibrio sp.]|nr:SirB2 family protein [Formivibrio sp.]